MLTYDALIDQAKIQGMPAAKMRGILREYLEILILKELGRTKAGKKLYFTGGTYLRLIHQLKRFSEDIDFNTQDLSQKQFESIFPDMIAGLKKTGIHAEAQFEYWHAIYAGKLIFPDIEKVYGIISPYSKKQGLMIKVETNKPKRRIKTETQVISGFGEFFPCLCTARGALFADKIDALVKKTRGRHLYDILFMLSNNFPIDKSALKSLDIKQDPLDVISERVRHLTRAELARQAENLRPFLFDEKEADWLIQAHRIIPRMLEKYGRENR